MYFSNPFLESTQYDRYFYGYSYIMEKYGSIIRYTDNASYCCRTDSNEFLDPCDTTKPEI